MLFETAIAMRVATTLCRGAREWLQGTFENVWYPVMGRLWIELAVDECRNLETWVERLRLEIQG